MSAQDLELVNQAIKGNQLAFRELIGKYQTRAYNIAYRIVGSKLDAEEIVQESFVKAYFSLNKFENRSSFYTWLFRIVYHMAIDSKRRTGRRDSEVEYDETIDSGSDNRGENSPFENIVRKEHREQIAGAMSMLSEEHKSTFLLREIEGLDYTDISKITGVGVGTVMSRLHYARKRLQQILSTQIDENEDESRLIVDKGLSSIARAK